jgi:biotin-(acetyl-CoA carboxylase) ligase
VIDEREIVQVVRTHLMPRWLKTLQEWLEQIGEEDMEEVLEWYQGWKQYMPEVVWESAEIEEIMRMALEMI